MCRMPDTPKRAYNEGRFEDAGELLRREYARKPARRLIQVDGHSVGRGDDVMHADKDGHCLMAGETYEPRNIAGTSLLPVRIEVYEGADKQEVLAILAKMYSWLAADWEAIKNPGSLPEPPEVDEGERRGLEL